MAERIKIKKKWNKTGQHTNNHRNSFSIDKGSSLLEVSRSRWSPEFLAETFQGLYKRMTTQMDGLIINGMDIPKWMTTGNTISDCNK